MPLTDLAQSLGLFLVVCLATAVVLWMAMLALARMERATVPVAVTTRRPAAPHVQADPPTRLSDRVSSPGSCTYGPRL
jgi:hypothetical protein